MAAWDFFFDERMLANWDRFLSPCLAQSGTGKCMLGRLLKSEKVEETRQCAREMQGLE